MSKMATLYRMDMGKHVCPYGLRAKDLLKRNGYSVQDIPLTSEEEIDQVKTSLDVKTTPQVIIDDTRVGGFEDLQLFLGKNNVNTAKENYFPVIALFLVASLMTAVLGYSEISNISTQGFVIQFIGLSMIMLGLLKLQNIDSFVNGFLGYDLFARKYVPYAYAYPYLEVLSGLLMIGGLLPILSIPIMLCIGAIGGTSVFKAVYIDKRELKCACVGGSSNVPLGFVSFLENAIMFSAATWMLIFR